MSGTIDVIAGLKGMLEYIERENIDHLQQDILKGAIWLIEEKRKESEPTSRSERHIEKLFKLIKENPGLEILPMVDSECVQGDDFSYWMGEWGFAEIDEYFHLDEKSIL